MLVTEMQQIDIREANLLSTLNVRKVAEINKISAPDLAAILRISGKEAYRLRYHAAILTNIKGLSTSYLNALSLTGINSLPELANAVPEAALEAVRKVQSKAKLKKLPSIAQVRDWVAQAEEICS